MANQNPEQIARDHIDRMFLDAGWVIQDFKELDLSAGQGISEVNLKFPARLRQSILKKDFEGNLV